MKIKSVKDYLIYSIGEIFLVVIGILIAVQVNNWNQGRISDKKEIQALRDLENEFLINEEKIGIKQTSRISIIPEIENYISEISSGKANYNSFSKFHKNEFMFGMTNPSLGVIDALISSSEISIITNDSLKYYLSGWKNELENLYENEQILWNSGLEFIGSYSNEIPDSRYDWFDSNTIEIKSITINLLNSTEYRNKLVGFAGCNKIVIEECNNILFEIQKIKSLFKKELKSKE